MEEKERDKKIESIEKKVDEVIFIASSNKLNAKIKVINLFFTGLTAALFYTAVVSYIYLGGADALPKGLFCFGVLTGVFYIVFLWILSSPLVEGA